MSEFVFTLIAILVGIAALGVITVVVVLAFEAYFEIRFAREQARRRKGGRGC